jgi:LmbE family N-acetylglucosaminyl deacetylase
MPRVLAVGAHHDDVEIGCGGALARHRAVGDATTILVASASGYDHWREGAIRSSDTARAEGAAGAAVLGAELLSLDLPTKGLVCNHELIEGIERVIVERRIDLVYTHWTGDTHQDHRAVAGATLAAARNLGSVLMYRSNPHASGEPWVPTVFVDIGAYADTKEAALRAHASELRRRGEVWLEQLRAVAVANGAIAGVRQAEAFVPAKLLLPFGAAGL